MKMVNKGYFDLVNDKSKEKCTKMISIKTYCLLKYEDKNAEILIVH